MTTGNENKSRSGLPILKIFHYATLFDLLLVAGGSLMSAMAGIALPMMFVVIGLAITEFADFVTANRLSSSGLNLITSNGQIALTNLSIDHFCFEEQDIEGFLGYLTSDNPSSMLQSNLYKLSYGILAIATGRLLGSLFSTILWSLTAIRQEKRIKSSFIRAVLNHDVSYYDLHPSTELSVLLIDDVKNIKNGISSACGESIFQISSAVASFGIALYFDWRLSLVATSIIVLLLTLLGVFGTVVGIATSKEQSFLVTAGSWAEQVLSSIQTVIAYSGESKELERYNYFLGRAHIYSYVKTFCVAILYVFYHSLLHLIFCVCLWYGGELFVSCSGITVGEIISVILLTSQVCISVGYIVLPLTTLVSASVSADSIFPVIEKESKIIEFNDSSKTVLEEFNGNIQFSGVSFSYPSRPEAKILQGIDLGVKPGQAVALVGPSGCGKSTIMNLIPRIYEFEEGNIKLDGVDIRDLSVKWLRSQIGVVSQEPVLFNVSIAENIGYGKEGATKEEIEAAAVAANAHSFISDLPLKYDTIVGDFGSQLSGGQKQRIAIARALVSNPKILLLDEATSALDTESEKLVQRALDKAREGRTTIIIAHRLSTIQTADVIVGIDKGRVVEMGTHSELMEKQSLYHGLVVSQKKQEEEVDEEKKYFQRDWKKSTRRSTARSSKKNITKRKRSTSSMLRRKSTSLSIGMLQRKTSTSSYGLGSPRKSLPQIEMELEDVFENVQMDLDQETELVTGNIEEQASLRDLFVLVKQDWWLLLLGIISFGLVGVEVSCVYILMSQAIDVFTETDPDVLTNDLEFFIYWYAFLAVAGAIIYFVGVLSLGMAADRLSKRVRSQSFKTILKQEVSFFDREENSLGSLVLCLVDDPSNINQVTGIPIGFLSRIVFAAFASIFISLYASWAIAFILLPAYPILVFGFISEICIGRTLTERGNYNYSNRIAIEAIENISTVATLGIADKIAQKFENSFGRPARYSMASGTVHAFLYAFTESFIMFATAAALAVSGKIFDETDPEIEQVSANFSNIFLAITSLLLTSLLFRDAFNSVPDFQAARISASRVSRLLGSGEQSSSDQSKDNGRSLDSFSAAIQSNSLFFSYPTRPEVSVLNGLSISVKPGHTLALVGPSGSGKSTIISLMQRFYDPTFGDLQVDDVDVHDLNIPWLRQQMSLVSQEPVLFDMSVADNIRYGANFREVKDEEIQEAAKSANIHDFILSLPEGYNTNVGLKGTQLSGGQKQRIAIARALVRNPKILLLDEATSALDTESERVVQEALEKASEGRTTIVVAHRLSTIQNADCIAVLYKGKVAEKGTHSQLMKKEGLYYTMISSH